MDTIETAVSSRTDIYNLLARLYRAEVDERMLCSLRQADLSIESDGSETSPMTEGFLLMAQYLNSNSHAEIDLARDYAKVFCGACSTGMQAAYPFESVYTSKDHLLMQEARDEVLALYQTCGFAVKENWHDPEDHIALELEFMALLSRQTSEALAEGDTNRASDLLNRQLAFARDHLLNWVPAFTRDVLRFAATDFYKGVAYLTEAFLPADFDFLSELVDEGEATVL
ncbi:MAG: molecular chaperone [Coriobacteriia bacterium]